LPWHRAGPKDGPGDWARAHPAAPLVCAKSALCELAGRDASLVRWRDAPYTERHRAAVGRQRDGRREVADQQCRRCGCRIGKDAFERNGVTYCCRACAERFECECGCITEYDSG